MFKRLYGNRISVISISLAVFLILALTVFTSCQKTEKKSAENWISLFNGTDLNNWQVKIAGYELGDNFGNTFSVQDSVIKVSYDQYDTFNNRFGHIYYKEKFSHYKIRVEYRFIGEQAPGGEEWAKRNSGVMLHCQAPETIGLNQNFPVSIEAQLLGGNGGEERSTGNLCTPGTNVVMNGELYTTHCINSSSLTFDGDQWVTFEAEVLGDSLISHFVNGELVLQYQKTQYDSTDADAKPLITDGDLTLSSGYISLQSESHPVEFRKVELLILNK